MLLSVPCLSFIISILLFTKLMFKRIFHIWWLPVLPPHTQKITKHLCFLGLLWCRANTVKFCGSMNSEKAAVVLRSLISIHHGDVIQVWQSVNKIRTFSLTQMWGWEKPLFAHIINLTWNTADAVFFQMAVPQASTILFNTAYSSHLIYPIALVWLTLHLDQKLCLDAAGSLAFILVPRAAQRVHLVDEDDWRFVLAS